MKEASIIILCLILYTPNAFAMQSRPLEKGWVNTAILADQAGKEALTWVYEHMMAADYPAAEQALRRLHGQDPSVLELWLALLTETAQFDTIGQLVAQGIVDPQHNSAVLARLYAGRPAPLVAFAQAKGEVKLAGHFLVDVPRVVVEINGQSYYFVVDTGASMNVISERVAGELGLVLNDRLTVSLDTSTERKVAARLAILPPFRFGPAEAQHQATVVVADEMLTPSFLGINWFRLDGIIGWPIIKKLDLAIDFSQGTVLIAKPVRRSGHMANLVWLFDDPMVITEPENGPSLLLFLDTGAQHSQVTPAYLSTFKLADPKWSTKQFDGLGGKGREEKTAEIGPVRFRLPSTSVVLETVEVRAEHVDCKYSHCHGRIGVDTVQGKVMQIDFTNGLFDILPGSGLQQPEGIGGGPGRETRDGPDDHPNTKGKIKK